MLQSPWRICSKRWQLPSKWSSLLQRLSLLCTWHHLSAHIALNARSSYKKQIKNNGVHISQIRKKLSRDLRKRNSRKPTGMSWQALKHIQAAFQFTGGWVNDTSRNEQNYPCRASISAEHATAVSRYMFCPKGKKFVTLNDAHIEPNVIDNTVPHYFVLMSL
jgi:hypothetical protein